MQICVRGNQTKETLAKKWRRINGARLQHTGTINNPAANVNSPVFRRFTVGLQEARSSR